MSNIDNIIEKIEADSQKKSDEIINSANEEAKIIVEKSKNKADAEAKKIIDKANRDASVEEEKALAGAQLKARDMVLRAQEQVVDRVFEKVKEKLNNLSNEEYLKYLKNSLANMDLSSDSKLMVPNKYREVVKNSDVNIELSDEEVRSGFSILKGNILYNNKFDSIVDVVRTEEEVKVFEELFKK